MLPRIAVAPGYGVVLEQCVIHLHAERCADLLLTGGELADVVEKY